MTASLEHPLVVPGPTVVQRHSLVEPCDEPRTTLRMSIAVSRDQLAAALDMGLHAYYGNYDRHPDQWTTAEIHYHASHQILCWSALDLQQAAESVAEMAEPDFYDREVHELVMAVYRAVDRAYPELAGEGA